jgi:hypothetical protein
MNFCCGQEWDWTLFFLNREVHYSVRRQPSTCSRVVHDDDAHHMQLACAQNRASADDMESWEVIGYAAPTASWPDVWRVSYGDGPITYRNEERGRAKQMKELVRMGVNNKNERDDEKPLYCLTLIHCRKVLHNRSLLPAPPRSQHGSHGLLSCPLRPRTKLCGAVPPFGRSPSARGFRSSTCFGFLLHSFIHSFFAMPRGLDWIPTAQLKV